MLLASLGIGRQKILLCSLYYKVEVSKIECDIIHTLRFLIGNEVFVGTTMRKKWLWGRHKVVGFKG